MTSAENERLAVVEIEIKGMKSDLGEVKADVKTLVVAQQMAREAEIREEAVRQATQAAHKNTGVWVRWIGERAIAIGALVVSLIAILRS